MTREDINDIINAICPNDEDYEKPCISSKYLRQELEQLALDQRQWNEDSTTKNNLVVDCISKTETLKAMETWDKFGYSARYGLERLDKDDKEYIAYVKYEDMVKCVKEMPSVTPIRPKGHWIYDRANVRCSNCGKGYKEAFGRTSASTYNYCPNCGADMKEVEE